MKISLAVQKIGIYSYKNRFPSVRSENMTNEQGRCKDIRTMKLILYLFCIL